MATSKFKVGDRVMAGEFPATVYEVSFSYCVEYADGGFGAYYEDEMSEFCEHFFVVNPTTSFPYCPKCGDKL